MFRSLYFEDKEIAYGDPVDYGIPDVYSDRYYWLTWSDNDCADDVLKRHGINSFPHRYSWFKVWSKDSDEDGDSSIEVSIFEMRCCKTNDLYFLIVLNNLYDGESLYNSCSVGYNEFNLYKFYRDYLLPFSEKTFNNGC